MFPHLNPSTFLDRVSVIGAEPKSPVPITIDNREKKPILFPPTYVCTSIAYLKTFDYAVTGDDRWALERKSIPDLVQTFISNRSRELRKIERARIQFDPTWPLIYIIDGTLSDLINYDWSRCQKITPQFFFSMLTDVSVFYRVHFLFASSTQEVAFWIYRYLKTRHKYITKESRYANR